MTEKIFEYRGLNIRYLEFLPTSDCLRSQSDDAVLRTDSEGSTNQSKAQNESESKREDQANPMVMMFHGWGTNADLFEQAGAFLSTKYHVVAPDMPGFGKSDEPTEPYDLDDYVDFAAAITRHVLGLDEEFVQDDLGDAKRADGKNLTETIIHPKGDTNDSNVPEVIMLGHSHGGRILLRMMSRQAGFQNTASGTDEKAVSDTTEKTVEKGAADFVTTDTNKSTTTAATDAGKQTNGKEFGFRITKAILTDSAGIVPEKTEAQKQKTAEYKRYKALLTKTGIAKVAPGLMDKLQKKYGSADYAAASPVMRQSMVKVVNTDLRAEMPSIKIPVLLIWGDADTATPLSDGKEMERLMPEAGLAVMPGCTHFCFLENPVLYNRILGSFLGIG